ncbi:glycosyltransferase family 2 protein [Mucilaginibacter myungsuensis]|uniref:Glycosyltransferase family 2 protein n=1 Tax=Mucilaginibacter myungsuensis TaxID=649104 RepID=A0A929KU25_9SPHI|nr:glycosyltransferase family 2 protein [Mucilaginibacter myungsuensis]MBE9660403.1 glycosyltransferase family 2 protein [Mucilaginibacter myungsuensis]MDN3600446.1 glycosyltransferase family 2 protein [Mucilaginibacter myungsuensis]
MTQVDANLLQALILTKNEEPNLDRVLDKLRWLDQVVIIDSFSTDNTLTIAKRYPNVRIYQRAFDTHADQWNYGLSKLISKWVLTLDADYILTDEFIRESMDLIANDTVDAATVRFKFLVFGQTLFGDNTMPRPVLFKRIKCHYFNDGHTQRLHINGSTTSLISYILHDDRKSLSRWLSNQDGYAIKESKKLTGHIGKVTGLSSRLRKTKILAPFLVFFHCLIVKRLIFNGWRGWHYTLQRTMVEMILALRLIEEEKLSNDLK